MFLPSLFPQNNIPNSFLSLLIPNSLFLWVQTLSLFLVKFKLITKIDEQISATTLSSFSLFFVRRPYDGFFGAFYSYLQLFLVMIFLHCFLLGFFMVVFWLEFLKLFIIEVFCFFFCDFDWSFLQLCVCFGAILKDEIKQKVVASYISNPTLFSPNPTIHHLSLDEHSNTIYK